MTTKFINVDLNDIYTKKIINYNGVRLKSIYLINIVDMFINRYLYFNKDNIKLNSEILKFLYGSQYIKYIQYLIDKQFIYLYKNYSVGTKSKCYKLTENAKSKKTLTVNVTLPVKLDNKIKKLTDNVYTEEFIKNKLISDLAYTKIDYYNAKQWINNNLDKNSNSYLSNITSINRINNNDIYYVFDKFGRFHTNFTTLKKDIRLNYLIIDNEKIKEIDITNSQPFFLYLFMKQNGFTNFNGFDKDVLSGTIYEKIKNATNIDRKEAKLNTYAVMFGRNLSKYKWNKIFNNLYPDVYEWIKNYKIENKNYKIIAHKLQHIEANFMFNVLIPKIINYNKDIKLITIHDSIIIQEKYYNDVKNIFMNCLKELIKNNNEDQ